jgi:hypothetical protein
LQKLIVSSKKRGCSWLLFEPHPRVTLSASEWLTCQALSAAAGDWTLRKSSAQIIAGLEAACRRAQG